MNGDFSVELALLFPCCRRNITLKTLPELWRRRQSSGPTCIGGDETKVDNQVAAPAEARTPNWHRAEISVLEECGWKGGAVEERLLIPSDYALIILVDQAGHCSWAIRDLRRPR